MLEKTPDNLIALVNKLANIDIGIVDVAIYSPCNLTELPSEYEAAINLTIESHSKLILDLNIEKPKYIKGITDFDLSKYIQYYNEEDPDLENKLKWISEYFQGKKVEIIQGKGEEPDDFEFDWILVLDTENKTLFSFILNLQD